MSPSILCPYCGLDLLELPNHDLFTCKANAVTRQHSQVQALERLYRLKDPREEK